MRLKSSNFKRIFFLHHPSQSNICTGFGHSRQPRHVRRFSSVTVSNRLHRTIKSGRFSACARNYTI